MTVAWRLARAPHATRHAAFSGEGARRYGGRWNSPGVAVVYLSSSLSLAALESLAHADRHRFERTYAAFRLQLEDEDVLRLEPSALPRSWQARPTSAEARALGDGWVRDGASLALSVPSVIVPVERNLLLNPAHPHAERIVVDAPIAFRFDARLATAPTGTDAAGPDPSDSDGTETDPTHRA